MSKIKKDTIVLHLKKLGVKNGDSIVVHSQLFMLGGVDIDDVYNGIFEVIGPNGTLAVPTYTFSVKPPEIYDTLKTSGEVGVFGNYVRKKNVSVRSNSPIHSHSIIGKNSNLFLSTPCTESIGGRSDFSIFYKKDFKLVLLGVDFNSAATYIHHVETCCSVPYRSWVLLGRIIRLDNGKIKHINCKYYARNKFSRNTRFNVVMEGLKYTSDVIGYGESYCVKVKELHSHVEKMLSSNPYSLLESLNTVKI
jgi:aminoglycoside 3-N-acetyltransferase